MGIKLSEIEADSPITLYVYNNEHKMPIDAVIKSIVKDNIANIELKLNTDKVYSFENVKVDMEYCFEGVPLKWRDVRIANHKSEYYMQVSSDGVRHNRRDYFRVGVSTYGQFRREGHGTQQILIKDISLSGFAITDRSKELKFQEGDSIYVSFQDMGYSLELKGRVARIDEQEDKTIYGLEICNLCKGLSAYVNMKQSMKRSQARKNET